MPHPFGAAQLSDGTGTTPDDMQLLIAQRWRSQGRIDGCKLTRSSSLMRYTIGEGSAIVHTAANRAVEVPILSTTLTAAAAPSSGSRRDYIVAKPDGTLAIVTSPPAVGAGAVLWEVVVPAGITNTNAATVVADNRMALPAHSPLGTLASWVNPAAGGTSVGPASWDMWSVTLPATLLDRSVEVIISHSMQAASAGSYRYELWLNGSYYGAARLGYGPEGSEEHTHFFLTLTARLAGQGGHTILVKRAHHSGPAAKYTTGGRPTYVKVTDEGAVE